MDVTCERCGTEYEFDETLVSDRGTTVKCTNCGHLFKVFRGSGASGGTPPPGAEPKTWTLRTQDGERRPIGSLKELQRFITEGRVTEDDQISRSGEGWKRLGDIAELQTFFAAARAAAVAPRAERRDGTARGLTRGASEAPPARHAAPAAPARKGTMMGLGGMSAGDDEPEDAERRPTHKMAVPPPAQASPSPPARARAATPEPHGEPDTRGTARQFPTTRRDMSAPEAPPEHRDPTARQRMERARTEAHGGMASTPPPPTSTTRMGSGDLAAPRPLSERPPAPARPQAPAARPAEPRAAQAAPTSAPVRSPSDRPPPLRLDEDEDVPAGVRRRGGSSALWVGLLVVLAIAVGVVLQWERIQGLLGGGGSAGAEFLAVADEHLAQDRDDAYRDAASEYTKALALDDHDVRAMVGLSRAHALLAQSHLFAADDLEARAGDDAALRGEAAALRREATTLAGDARENAEGAVRIGTGGADAEVALADALRLSGDPLARSRIDRARTLEPTASAETLRVDALIAASESPTGLAAAVPLAEQAVTESPSLLRARLLLARALLAAGDATAARAQVQAVLTRAPEHPLALALSERLEGGALVAVDGGVAGETPPIAAIPPTADPAGAGTEPAGTGAEPPPEGAPPEAGGSSGGGRRSYESLVADAERALEAGSASRARGLYEQALSARPGGAEALTGLGFALLDSGDVNGAIARFRLASSGGYPRAFIGLGDAYRRLGDSSHALEAYENYLSRSPTGSDASIARRQVDRLRGAGARLPGESSGGGSEPSGGSSSGGGSEPSGGSSSGGSEPSGGSSSGGSEPSGGSSSGGAEAPPTPPGHLPAPLGTTEHPPTDTPALENEP